jgi:SagB-type dehydrogenase family enzyme
MVPSGGGLYPLELYLIVNQVEQVPQGIYHYAIYPPLLEQVYALEFSKLFISQLFMNQPYVAESSVILVATSFFKRNMHKYGDRGYRYILYEAGHLFQNINLIATALGLGTLNLGGFFDDEVTRLLKINNEEEIPLYSMGIGIPEEKGSEQTGPVL